MQVLDAELWAIRLALDVAMEKRDTLQQHGVKLGQSSATHRPQFDERHTWSQA